MKLFVRAFRINLDTDRGDFGATALFEKGLNVIRAENTSGKSALINGILYALGLEILVGKKSVESLKPVLWREGDCQDVIFSVAESSVELEAMNSAGDVITVRRYAKGEKDPRLVEVIFDSIITGAQKKEQRVEPFFVHLEGAAQRERGFHAFFADFFDLQLPDVKRFRGEDVPLYVECIAPLMIIEQLRGWSGIQATLPQSFGIRNVAKIAVEYVLDLDVIENEKRRIRITEEANEIRESWRANRELMNQIALRVGGRLMNVPSSPIPKLQEEPWILLPTDHEDSEVSLADLLIKKRSERFGQTAEEIPAPSDSRTEKLEKELEEHENKLIVTQAELRQLRSEIRSDEEEVRQLNGRLEFIEADIQRNRDIERLRQLGVEVGISIAKDRCPTCRQVISDSLVPTESTVMSLEENINFLKSEQDAIKLLIASGEERLARNRGVTSAKSQATVNLRSVIRDLKSDLMADRDYSVAEIRQEIHLEEEIARLEKLRDDFDNEVERLNNIADRWKGNRALWSELPAEYFSKKDKQKLSALSDEFAANVVKFGYRSTGISRLHISEDNYRPVCDDFEVAFGASASDNIRLIWAYTWALLQVSLRYGGNHWGILVFDEPEQQKVKDASSDILYREIANTKGDLQVIIATSASERVNQKRLRDIPHNLLEFGSKVVRPLPKI